MPEPTPAELEHGKQLLAKAWRGACQLCPGMMWFADTEDEITATMTTHIKDEHVTIGRAHA